MFRTQGSGYTKENGKCLFWHGKWQIFIDRETDLEVESREVYGQCDSLDLICWGWGNLDVAKHFWESGWG